MVDNSDLLRKATNCIESKEPRRLFNLLFMSETWFDDICDDALTVQRRLQELRSDIQQSAERHDVTARLVWILAVVAASSVVSSEKGLAYYHSLGRFHYTFRARPRGLFRDDFRRLREELTAFPELDRLLSDGVSTYFNNTLRRLCLAESEFVKNLEVGYARVKFAKAYLSVLVSCIVDDESRAEALRLWLIAQNNKDSADEALQCLAHCLFVAIINSQFSLRHRLDFLLSALLAIRSLDAQISERGALIRLHLIETWWQFEQQMSPKSLEALDQSEFVDTVALWLRESVELRRLNPESPVFANPAFVDRVVNLARFTLEQCRIARMQSSLATNVVEEISISKPLAAIQALTEVAWDSDSCSHEWLWSEVEGLSTRMSFARRTASSVAAGENISDYLRELYTVDVDWEQVWQFLPSNTFLLGLYDIPNGVALAACIFTDINRRTRLFISKGTQVQQDFSLTQSLQDLRSSVARARRKFDGDPDRASQQLRKAHQKVQSEAEVRFRHLLDDVMSGIEAHKPDLVIVPRGICGYAFPDLLGSESIIDRANSIRFLPSISMHKRENLETVRSLEQRIGLILHFADPGQQDAARQEAERLLSEAGLMYQIYPNACSGDFLRAANECSIVLCVAHGVASDVSVLLEDGLFPSKEHVEQLICSNCDAIVFCCCDSATWKQSASELYGCELTFGPIGKALTIDIALRSNKAIGAFLYPVQAAAGIKVGVRMIQFAVKKGASLAQSSVEVKRYFNVQNFFADTVKAENKTKGELLELAFSQTVMDQHAALSLRVIERWSTFSAK